ncbi:MAG: DUF3179 domain-containing protein, partial [Gammaproteobacteria bacterium]|nr:DUF3179 domain-containing protein [Gammaproteobacteria bacterium]
MHPIVSSRHWAMQLFRVCVLVMMAWWLMGAPNLLAQYGLVEEWPNTDFKQHSVPLSEIISGGPGKDGIPAIDKPEFLSVNENIDWLDDSEPVIALILEDLPGREGEVARAYPLQILIWHEIVNDEIAGLPVAVTFCPLCNASVVFDRRLDGKVLDFGTTGRLRKSDMVMYDRQTESWWQQFMGKGIVGEMTGKTLKVMPSRILSWKDFRTSWPDGYVLSKDTGFYRNYGVNPYQGYDDIKQTPFLLDESPDPRLKAMDRVAVLKTSGGYRAYPYSKLETSGVIHDEIDSKPVVFLTRKNTRSPLDKRLINQSRLMISAQAFSPFVSGQQL